MQRALLEGTKLKGLLPSLQTAAAQTTSDISAVQTSLQKLNELLSKDRDWSVPIDHTAKDSKNSEGSRGVHEHTSEANGQITHNANNHNTIVSKADSRQNQSTDRHDSQTPVPEVNTYQSTAVVMRRRTKSDSAGMHKTTGLIKAHRVVSDYPPNHDVYKPHQQLAPQTRREQIEH